MPFGVHAPQECGGIARLWNCYVLRFRDVPDSSASIDMARGLLSPVYPRRRRSMVHKRLFEGEDGTTMKLVRLSLVALVACFVATACEDGPTRGDVSSSGGFAGTRAAPNAPPPGVAALGGIIADGSHAVGRTIVAGRYRSVPNGRRCHWDRTTPVISGRYATLAIGVATGSSAVVDVRPTDGVFTSIGGCRWTPVEAAVTLSPYSSFADGTYVVGLDIAPGLWTSAGLPGCFWQRSANFTGELQAVRDAQLIREPRPVTVLIESTDAGFTTSGCGHWVHERYLSPEAPTSSVSD
jgi:hypothetical protein